MSQQGIGFDDFMARAEYLTTASVHSRRQMVEDALARLGYRVSQVTGWGMVIRRGPVVVQKRGRRQWRR